MIARAPSLTGPERESATRRRSGAAPAPTTGPTGATPTATAAPPAASPGQGLLPSVRPRLERIFGVDLGGVRVHTDAEAAAKTKEAAAKAMTVGPDIFLAPGERPTDLELLAHEVAHVVQQRQAPAIQLAGSGRADAYEREAERAAASAVRNEPIDVRERVNAPRAQRLGLSDVLDYFAEKANIIPGYRMFTIALGVNPINMSRVERSAANILRALIEFIPGGYLVTQALDNNGVFDKAGAFVEKEVAAVGLSGAAIKKSISDFIDSLGWRDIFHLGDVWDRAKRIFTDPVGKLIQLAKNVIVGIVTLIKDAILRPLAKLAEGTRAWDLLIAVLGKNPITGDTVPRTPDTLIGGFMKLIGQEEVWSNMKKANAVGRAWTWFQATMSGLIALVSALPTNAINAFKSLELMDIVLVYKAFIKVGKVFATFVIDFIKWAGNAVWNLLEIVFDVVSPGAWGYIKKTGAALKSILKNPFPFVGNLVKAAKDGFLNFAKNFVEHLKRGLIDWLTGSLQGVYIPKAFNLVEVLKFALSILGISWANIRAKLVKAVGETAVKAMETAFDIVVVLVRDGPAAAWEKIKEELTNLKDTVVEGIKDFIIDTVKVKAIPKLIAMFIPGAGFISAIISIYDTVMVFVQKISKIIEVVKGFVDSIVAIAAGQIAAASKRVETILAGLLSLAISFLAGFVGLGKVADKVMGVINKVRATIDKGLDKLVDWIVTMAKKVGKFIVGTAKSAVGAVVDWWRGSSPFSDRKGRPHKVFFAGQGEGARLKVASTEMFSEEFATKVETVMANDPIARTLGTMPLATCRSENKKVDAAKIGLARAQAQRDNIQVEYHQKRLNDAMRAMASSMGILIDLLPENRDTSLPVKVGQFVTVPYKKTTGRKGEILVISNLHVRYKVDAISGVLQMPTPEFLSKWGSQIFEWVEGSLRDKYLGATPGKASATGRVVVARYRQRMMSGLVEVEWRASTWHELLDCDMSHAPVDAVDYWNNTGRHTGPKSDSVRAWMLDPKNYILEPAAVNRGRGSVNNSRYQPPTA